MTSDLMTLETGHLVYGTGSVRYTVCPVHKVYGTRCVRYTWCPGQIMSGTGSVCLSHHLIDLLQIVSHLLIPMY